MDKMKDWIYRVLAYVAHLRFRFRHRKDAVSQGYYLNFGAISDVRLLGVGLPKEVSATYGNRRFTVHSDSHGMFFTTLDECLAWLKKTEGCVATEGAVYESYLVTPKGCKHPGPNVLGQYTAVPTRVLPFVVPYRFVAKERTLKKIHTPASYHG